MSKCVPYTIKHMVSQTEI